MPDQTFWKPLPDDQWDEPKARHLALRIGYSAHPEFVRKIYELGPSKTLETLLGSYRAMPEPRSINAMRSAQSTIAQMEPSERRKRRRELQRKGRESYADYAVAWYAFARAFESSVQEKLVQFFANVWVVAFQGVRDVPALFAYQDTIRKNLNASYPDMCKRLSRTEAMIRYLNLNQNKASSPNENFARELFELFTLGEGNYSENDIKEAARATTGFTLDPRNGVSFRPRRHDSGKKTIFGKTDSYDLDGVIDLVFEQPAAATFLPREICRFYLSDSPLSEEAIEELGQIWREADFDIPTLYRTLFASKHFYSPEYQGNLIKSPEQFYIGTLQSLNLDVPPLARSSFRMTRSMGQAFFNPPNVRGWVGGRQWINSATLAARNQFIDSLLYAPDESKFNADEQRALAESRAEGINRFWIQPEMLSKSFPKSPQLVSYLEKTLYPNGNDIDLSELLAQADELRGLPRAKQYLAILRFSLSLPNYHLC